VVQALVSADVAPAETPTPGVAPLAQEAWRALRTKLSQLLDTVGRQG